MLEAAFTVNVLVKPDNGDIMRWTCMLTISHHHHINTTEGGRGAKKSHKREIDPWLLTLEAGPIEDMLVLCLTTYTFYTFNWVDSNFLRWGKAIRKVGGGEFILSGWDWALFHFSSFSSHFSSYFFPFTSHILLTGFWRWGKSGRWVGGNLSY